MSTMKITPLKTQRLVLRAPIPTDAERIQALANNWNVARMVALIPHPYTLADAHDYIAKSEAANAKDMDLRLALIHEDGYIGAIGIVPMRDSGAYSGEADSGAPTQSVARHDPGTWSIGYWLGEPYWGQGYMTEAAIAIVRCFFANSDQDRLASAYLADNAASGRIQDKLGFEIVGHGMGRSLARGGESPNVLTILTRERFLARHPVTIYIS